MYYFQGRWDQRGGIGRGNKNRAGEIREEGSRVFTSESSVDTTGKSRI